MTSALPHPPRGLRLELGRVSRVRVHVGYRAMPEWPTHEDYLLDLSLPEDEYQTDVDEQPFLDALQPAVYLGSDAPRHYSLHVHRWHTSWGAGATAFEIGLTVTTGPRGSTSPPATYDAVGDAFRTLLTMSDGSDGSDGAVRSRDEAVVRARRSVAAVYDVDREALSVFSEEHRRDRGSWSVGLRTAGGDRYAVEVGVVDGHAGAVHVRRHPVSAVWDSVGTE